MPALSSSYLRCAESGVAGRSGSVPPERCRMARPVRLMASVVLGGQLIGLLVFSTIEYQSFALGRDFAAHAQAWFAVAHGHLNPGVLSMGAVLEGEQRVPYLASGSPLLRPSAFHRPAMDPGHGRRRDRSRRARLDPRDPGATPCADRRANGEPRRRGRRGNGGQSMVLRDDRVRLPFTGPYGTVLGFGPAEPVVRGGSSCGRFP